MFSIHLPRPRQAPPSLWQSSSTCLSFLTASQAAIAAKAHRVEQGKDIESGSFDGSIDGEAIEEGTTWKRNADAVPTALVVIGVWVGLTNVFTLITWKAWRTRKATEQLLNGSLLIKRLMATESFDALWLTAFNDYVVERDIAYFSYMAYRVLVAFEAAGTTVVVKTNTARNMAGTDPSDLQRTSVPIWNIHLGGVCS